MASLNMAASFLGGAIAVTQRPAACRRRSLLAVRAAAGAESQDAATAKPVANSSNGRRAAMCAVAAAAVCAVTQGAAFADEPKRGTPEARKAYAPVCVTMPTARICNK